MQIVQMLTGNPQSEITPESGVRCYAPMGKNKPQKPTPQIEAPPSTESVEPSQSSTDKGGQSPGRKLIGKPINLRLPPELLADLDYVVDGLGLDRSNAIRTILAEQMYLYIERATLAKQNRERAKEAAKGDADP